jgi:hypothetical protein
MDRILAALETPDPEWPCLRHVEIEIGPAQIDCLTDPQPVTIHQVEQELVPAALATHITCCLDQSPRFVRWRDRIAVKRCKASRPDQDV